MHQSVSNALPLPWRKPLVLASTPAATSVSCTPMAASFPKVEAHRWCLEPTCLRKHILFTRDEWCGVIFFKYVSWCADCPINKYQSTPTATACTSCTKCGTTAGGIGGGIGGGIYIGGGIGGGIGDPYAQNTCDSSGFCTKCSAGHGSLIPNKPNTACTSKHPLLICCPRPPQPCKVRGVKFALRKAGRFPSKLRPLCSTCCIFLKRCAYKLVCSSLPVNPSLNESPFVFSLQTVVMEWSALCRVPKGNSIGC